MKKVSLMLGLVVLGSFFYTSCSKEDDGSLPNEEEIPYVYNPPTQQEFRAKQEEVFESIIQTTTFNAEEGLFFESERGAFLQIFPNCLSLNDSPVTGEVTLRFAEIYDRGWMLATNKTVTGKKPDNTYEQLNSGGEFLIEVYQDGELLSVELCGGMLLNVPVDNTESDMDQMQPFLGEIDEAGNLVWVQQQSEFWVGEIQNAPGLFYNAFINDFGWFNCDYFMNFPDPKTSLQIAVPQGYDHQNSAIYIALPNEPNSLGLLYGELPIGLDAHIIFLTTEGEDYRYAVQSITIEADQSLIFTIEETSVVSHTELIAAIDALP